MLGGSPVTFIVTDVTTPSDDIAIYGRFPSGESICARPKNFDDYFYVQLGNDTFPTNFDNLVHNAIGKNKSDDQIYVKELIPVMRTSIMGYQPNGPSPMIMVILKSFRYKNTCVNILEQKGYPTFEGSIKYVERFMGDKVFGGCDWIRIDEYAEITGGSTCDYNIEFNHEHLHKIDRSDSAVIRILSFDLECNRITNNGRGFVEAISDPVSQIGMTLYSADYVILDRRVLSLVPKGRKVTPLPDNVKVDIYEDEIDMFLSFRNYVIKNDPDILTGYNINKFDLPYLLDRAKALGISDRFSKLTRMPDKNATYKRSTFFSRAKGTQIKYKIFIEGRFTFDMLDYSRDNLKARSYGLGMIAQTFLGYAKVEMSYSKIPEYNAGTDEQRAHLCYYCWWDAHLCYELMKNQMVMINYIEAARVCGVPFKYLNDRGQQVLTTQLLLRFGNARGFVIPSSTESQNGEETAGAIVMNPLTGFYTDPVVTLDFRSLYPSIIDDSNICYSTEVPIRWARANLKEEDYLIPPIPGVEYCFVKSHIHKGILPQMEETLFAKRQEAKDDMKKEKDPVKKLVYNGKQNAIKTRMNSIYGYLKANTVCRKQLMEAVTGTGRFMLEACKELIERVFKGSKVVYGDSVTGDSPCLLRDVFGNMTVKTIESIIDKWTLEGDKEYGTTTYIVWTESGWTRINRVIRHYSDKPIVRVSTDSGIVDCTTDHGLVRYTGERVASAELKVGDNLMHSFPTVFRTQKYLHVKLAIEWAKHNKSPLDEILNADIPIKLAYWKEFKKHNVNLTFKKKIDAMRTFALLKSIDKDCRVSIHDGLYKIEKGAGSSDIKSIEILPTTNDYVYDLETENHHFHAGVGQMIVHNTDSVFIWFGKVSVDEGFKLGQEAADMCTELFTRGKTRKVHLLQREKMFKPYLLIGKKKYTGLKCLGPGFPWERSETGLENVRRDNALIGSETLDTVAEMIIVEGDYKAERAIKYIHERIQALLLGRIEISKLIISKNLSKSFEHYEKSNVKQPHVELAKKIAARAHNTGEQLYYTGDRVPYVMLANVKGGKSSECTEDPLFAMKNRLPIDFRYYIEGQMMKPLIRLLIPIIAKDESMKKRNKSGKKVYINENEMRSLLTYKALFVGSHMMSKIQRVQVSEDRGSIFAHIKKSEGCLSCGARLVPQVASATGGTKRQIDGSEEKRPSEMHSSSKSAFCPSCEFRKPLIYLRLQNDLSSLQTKKWASWSHCQVCVGEKHHEAIDCANRDCSNFYEREKVCLDIEDVTKKMDKL